MQLNLNDWKFIISTRAAEPDKGDKVPGMKTTVSVINAKGEFDDSILRSVFEGRGLKVAVQSQLRALAKPTLDAALADGVNKTAAVELATAEIPSEYDLDFSQFVLTGGSNRKTVDVESEIRARYKIHYIHALDEGKTEKDAIAYADKKHLEFVHSN